MSSFKNIHSDGVSVSTRYSHDEDLIIWSGNMWPNADQKIIIDWNKVTFGIVLEFVRYDPDEGKQDGMHYHHFFYPKSAATQRGTSGVGGEQYLLTSHLTGVIGMKYIYIDDTGLWGHDNNAKNGLSDPVFGTINNKYWCLSKVYRA